ncbi:RDD family protein [Methylovirgula sp. HY1]|uniref:RDD family protein n=1 Tax=Methylovirgula sp. HY1 TaxID=2822761 RepID=UPI001C5B595E|nr:RDD family protein [Methylovirgula sp. HY1]QXX75976.1 hypothetical protein MHY1_02810 [Methylovirgula sp. HY1]
MTLDGSNDPSAAVAPRRPFDGQWYLWGDAEALGPYESARIKAMIAQGGVNAETLIAQVGATEWAALKDVPVFAAWLGGTPRGVANVGGDRVIALPGSGIAEPPASVRYAGFWIRLLAYVIDTFIIEVFVIIAGALVGLIGAGLAMRNGAEPPKDAIDLLEVIGGLVGFTGAILYNVVFNSGRWQATPGKRLLGIHIVTVSGEPVGPWLALGRYFAYILSSLPLCIGFMMIGWTKEKTGLHDMICRTRVVHGKL